ncbi:putrescine transport system ATP-binding protein [Marinobacter segnicrescens]|uniref:Spermidine/putrescine import ATP-binding protein PotA n=1 Tax=Marinobacter segnicrescens TaxID=430453 RepID=A0A1I0DPU4_9GAMM|nr:polyamine ABC transporter ATP-binding protein [Marinobacter segnicrescens]SET33931.1 putrescine transport system ATP-binding protein [Marinobacter segnicrescens]
MAESNNTSAQVEVLLSIEGISKSFDSTLAVDNVSLDIHRGEIFALLGGSGSGKSTLLRMLAGFEKPDAGRIVLDGQDITNLPPYLRPTNMMFQSYALFPHMTVAQNIAMGLKQDRLPKAEIGDRVAAMLRLVKMESYATRKPHQLSGGQQQRVALARSLAKRPKLLLLDEPMGALDKKLRTEMQLELVDILEKVGATCLMVTHDQEEAMTMASRIAIMANGRIAQVGSPIDIYESPNSRMTAEFIGSVNIFEASIQADEADSITLTSELLDAPVFIDRGVTTPAETTDTLVALRPEKIYLTTDRPEGDSNWSQGTVDNIAYLGDITSYYVKLASGKRVQATMANVERRGDRPTWGDQVFVSWEASSPILLWN